MIKKVYKQPSIWNLFKYFFVEAAREVLRRVGFGSQKELLRESDKELGVRVLVLRGLSLEQNWNFWGDLPTLYYFISEIRNETSFWQKNYFNEIAKWLYNGTTVASLQLPSIYQTVASLRLTRICVWEWTEFNLITTSTSNVYGVILYQILRNVVK